MNVTDPAFAACLFHPDFGNQVVEGTIAIERGALRFRSDAGSEEIPVERIQLELEPDGDRVYFNDVARPELRLFTLDSAILEHQSFVRCPRFREQLTAIVSRRELRRRLRLTLCVLGGCLLLGWFASWLTGAMVRSLANRVPPQWEQQFGEEQIKDLEKTETMVNDSNELAQLDALASPLLRVVPLGKTKVRFYILEDPDPNAFALPGGYVVVNTGLLQMVDRPEELLAVLAHELAHVTCKHHIRRLIAASGPILIFGVFLHSHDSLLNLLSAGSGLMVFQGFSQEYETEADDVGWQYLVAAHINPHGMISMFQKFETYDTLKNKVPDPVPQAFRSHPALDKRLHRLEARWRRLSPKTGFLTLTNAVPKPDSEDSGQLAPERRAP